jgi:hypothetical protein
MEYQRQSGGRWYKTDAISIETMAMASKAQGKNPVEGYIVGDEHPGRCPGLYTKLGEGDLGCYLNLRSGAGVALLLDPLGKAVGPSLHAAEEVRDCFVNPGTINELDNYRRSRRIERVGEWLKEVDGDLRTRDGGCTALVAVVEPPKAGSMDMYLAAVGDMKARAQTNSVRSDQWECSVFHASYRLDQFGDQPVPFALGGNRFNVSLGVMRNLRRGGTVILGSDFLSRKRVPEFDPQRLHPVDILNMHDGDDGVVAAWKIVGGR